MHPEDLFTAERLERIRAGARPHPLYDPARWPKIIAELDADLLERVRKERAGK